MTAFEPGDIVRVPFPYVERPVQQHRPALVIGQPAEPSASLIWVLMITSAGNRKWVGDFEVGPAGATGLPVRSLVRTAKIATIERSAVSWLGRVSASELRAVRGFMAVAFGLAQDRPAV